MSIFGFCFHFVTTAYDQFPRSRQASTKNSDNMNSMILWITVTPYFNHVQANLICIVNPMAATISHPTPLVMTPMKNVKIRENVKCADRRTYSTMRILCGVRSVKMSTITFNTCEITKQWHRRRHLSNGDQQELTARWVDARILFMPENRQLNATWQGRAQKCGSDNW